MGAAAKVRSRHGNLNVRSRISLFGSLRQQGPVRGDDAAKIQGRPADVSMHGRRYAAAFWTDGLRNAFPQAENPVLRRGDPPSLTGHIKPMTTTTPTTGAATP
jgi:hypothetical protein